MRVRKIGVDHNNVAREGALVMGRLVSLSRA